MPNEHLRWHGTLPPLNEPILLVAFVRKSGYGTTAVASLTHLVSEHDGQVIAEIEPEHFFDFTVTSPAIELIDGQRVVTWPENKIYRLQQRQPARDVLVLLGAEPHLHWKTFVGAMQEFIAEAGVRQVVVVHSWPGAVPHTRPIFLQLTTEDAGLAARVDLPPTPLTYTGPIDIGTTLRMSFDASVTHGGLSAIVPNYLGVVPNPFAMIALVEAYDRLCGTDTDLERLRELAEQVRARADESIRESAELAEAIRRMEEQYEALMESATADDGSEDPLPSPSELLRDVEAFLMKGNETQE